MVFDWSANMYASSRLWGNLVKQIIKTTNCIQCSIQDYDVVFIYFVVFQNYLEVGLIMFRAYQFRKDIYCYV